MAKNVPYKRVDRVADLLRQVVSETLMTKVHHYGVEGITITEVQVSPDLKHGKIFYRVMDLEQKQDIEKRLEKVRPIMQKALSGALATRYTPVLRFVFDESFDYGTRIDALLSSVGFSGDPSADDDNSAEE